MLRNRGLLTQALASLALCCAATGIAFLAAGTRAASIVFLASLTLSCVYTLASYTRYRKIAKLAEEMDRALSGDRSVNFADMSEGELAILASEIDKTFSSLAIANESLEREKGMLANSLADISHQLRTPLTSLGLELELLRKEVSPENGQRVLATERQLERIQWLVSSLLKLARLDAGAVELTRQHVLVQDLVENAMEPLAISFDLASVELELAIESGTSFEGDPSWTREALTNVLKNCLEHTPAGGHVQIHAYEDSLACRIRIQDSGSGFRKEDIPHIFERFWRSPESKMADSTNPMGVGIGLSLARALIIAQDGQITASNAYDDSGKVCGAIFDISFFKLVV